MMYLINVQDVCVSYTARQVTNTALTEPAMHKSGDNGFRIATDKASLRAAEEQPTRNLEEAVAVSRRVEPASSSQAHTTMYAFLCASSEPDSHIYVSKS
jgi:hypothetical protein